MRSVGMCKGLVVVGMVGGMMAEGLMGQGTKPGGAGVGAATMPGGAATQQAGGRGRGGRGRGVVVTGPQKLADIAIRDICILPDPSTKTYYMVGPQGRGVREYESKDLVTWTGPRQIFSVTPGLWGDVQINGIWAPEIHAYEGKYYLFLTFSSNTPLKEQNSPTKPPLSDRPLVVRGSTTLVSDVVTGPFVAMTNHSVPPMELMTLDGTLWEEEGVPYMVYSHEWVQVTTGTMEAVKLKADLSEAVEKPFLLFSSKDAPWAKVQKEGCIVTDGPYFKKSKSGKLFMVWSSFDEESRYNVGLAISDSGKLAGPWRHQAEALWVNDGGHPMLFETFEGKLMMVFHAPNSPQSRVHMLEMEDTGETLKVLREVAQ